MFTEPKSLRSFLLKIESLAYRSGAGVGRHEGQVVFVPLTAPGDLVEVEVVSRKKNYLEARVLHVHQEGTSRRVAQCPYFGDCGGCQWQHVQYSEQLNQKALFFESLFRKFEEKPPLLPIIPSPIEWRYRSRIQVHVQAGSIGFKQARSEKVIDCPTCIIASENVQDQLTELRGQNPADGRYELREGGRGFEQVHRLMNQKLIEIVESQLQQFQPQSVWDLYGGNANLSGRFAVRTPSCSVSCVDLSVEALQEGQKRFQGVSNISFFHKSTESFLFSQKGAPDFIIADPPRQGLSSKVSDWLSKSKRPLLYLSCDPTTFIRDILKLYQNSSLRLRWAQPIDLFPQTAHLEVMGFLETR